MPLQACLDLDDDLTPMDDSETRQDPQGGPATRCHWCLQWAPPHSASCPVRHEVPPLTSDGPVSYEAIGVWLYMLGLAPRPLDGDRVRAIERRALRKLAVECRRRGLSLATIL